MLQNLHVKNLALIDEVQITFEPGLNILTGETGAGKSVLLGALSLALGGKYSAQMLKTGAKSGFAELTFTVDEKTEGELEVLDIFAEDAAVTFGRRFTESRSVCRINGETVSMGTLRAAAGLLIDIHGQRDSQQLLQRRNHLALLDLYAGTKADALKEKMAAVYHTWTALTRKEKESALDEKEQKREMSLAEYEIREIEEAALTPCEDEELEELYRRMSKGRDIAEALSETYRYTGDGLDEDAASLLGRAVRCLQPAAEFDEAGAALYDQLNELDSLLSDFNRDLAAYAADFEFSEEEFRETEDRLNVINHLKAKYGNSAEEILAYCEEKKKRLSELENYDAYLAGLREKIRRAKKEMEDTARELSEVRSRYARQFAADTAAQMKELNFLDSRFEVRLKQAAAYSETGRDEAEFFISVNPGEPMKPLSDVASGGELSRIMLAVKTVLADKEDTPTLVFDEIDAGISGVTAQKVAERLKILSENRQVICITHLPQIAAAADAHFCISKEAEDDTAHTRIRRLNEEESVQELARLLGGANITEHVLAGARELWKLGRRQNVDFTA